MKYLLASLLLSLSLALPVHAQDEDWTIDSFHSDVTVSADGIIDVKETIQATFNIEKHGIYRDIPVKYRNDYNQNVSLNFNLIGVTDETGAPYTYDASRDGAYEHIKIGDPDVTITGEHTYVIEYQATRGLRYFKDHDELYWNVTGNDWEVDIPNSSATIHFPFDLPENTQTICFTGYTGSTAQNCTAQVHKNSVDFSAHDFLTLAVSWPKGLTPEPALSTRIGWFISDNIGFSFPLFAFLLGYAIWSRKGRDPKGRGVVRQYEAPDKLSPAEVSFLIKQRADTNAIPAEIVWLANKGFVTFKEVGKKGLLKRTDYELRQTDKDVIGLKPHQKRLLDSLFADTVDNSIKISELPDDFYAGVQTVKDAVWSSIESKQYFAGKPERVTGTWFVAAFVTIFLLFFVAVISNMRLDLIVGAIGSGIILLVFAMLMSKRTEAGVAAYEYALGFKQYIDAAETERVKWEETQNLFFDVLPYAMVFGIAEKWAKAFEGKLQKPPEWYTGTTPFTFSTTNFNRSLSSFSTATISHSTPPSSNSSGFSGGGSSGGGGGGGGGGSW